MATLKISEKDKQKLRNAAKSEVERLERILQNAENIKVVDEFKNRFNVCESAYKVILAEHQKRKGKAQTKHLKIDMRQVSAALTFAGYTFDDQLLPNLFASKSTANGRTAKQLRDSTTHSFNESAVEEIILRRDELFGYMEEFVEIIKNFDLVTV